MYQIDVYENKDGKSEINDYLKKLRKSDAKENRIKLEKISMYIDLLEKQGLNLGLPYIKHISNEIWELRPLKDRILFVSWKNNKFVLLSIFKKQTKKTPRKEIKKAKRLLKEYKERSRM